MADLIFYRSNQAMANSWYATKDVNHEEENLLKNFVETVKHAFDSNH